MKSITSILVALASLSANMPAHAESQKSPVREREPIILSPFEAAVGRQQAARIARQTIERQTGTKARVTGISREDDHGARWEIEVTLRSGQEFDVYVNAAGRVVKVIRKSANE
ncbi:MAG: hypothetical protein MUF13_11855 [Akkermansiaceae bacterium]|nr:hypothetical protein [Akkermansiaceae bacterium]